MSFGKGDIVFLKKDSKWLYDDESYNNPFNMPGIITDIAKTDDLAIVVSWQYPEWHEDYYLVQAKLNTNTYNIDDLELLSDKKLSDYLQDIYSLAQKRNWNNRTNAIISREDNIEINTYRVGKIYDLLNKQKFTYTKIKQFIQEVINFHFKYGKGEIKFF